MAEKENNAFTTAFLIGVMAGVAIGVLFAPAPGRETRAKLKDKADEIKDMASERIGKSREAVTEAGRKVRVKLG